MALSCSPSRFSARCTARLSCDKTRTASESTLKTRMTPGGEFTHGDKLLAVQRPLRRPPVLYTLKRSSWNQAGKRSLLTKPGCMQWSRRARRLCAAIPSTYNDCLLSMTGLGKDCRRLVSVGRFLTSNCRYTQLAEAGAPNTPCCRMPPHFWNSRSSRSRSPALKPYTITHCAIHGSPSRNVETAIIRVCILLEQRVWVLRP